ncbi:MAG: hypothetical protein GY931_20220 [Maribacter sp.]|nr:hypothetical protein [Maribacter sp.]
MMKVLTDDEEYNRSVSYLSSKIDMMELDDRKINTRFLLNILTTILEDDAPTSIPVEEGGYQDDPYGRESTSQGGRSSSGKICHVCKQPIPNK